MTDDRSLERAARSWIEAGPTRAPDRVVEAALHQIDTTPQERGLALPWRFHPMTRFALAGAAVALATIVAVAGLTLNRAGPAPDVGGPSPSFSPTVSPNPSPTDSPGPATMPPNHPTPWPVFPSSPLDEPPGDALPDDLIGRTYVADPPESHLQPGQMLVLTLRPADDPHCDAMYDGQSTCFTYLWTPNWPKHVTDPGARGAARIVDGELVLRFDIVPSDAPCVGKSAIYSIDDDGATLSGVNTPGCTVPGFIEQ
jgi:hypothetical protein